MCFKYCASVHLTDLCDDKIVLSNVVAHICHNLQLCGWQVVDQVIKCQGEHIWIPYFKSVERVRGKVALRITIVLIVGLLTHKVHQDLEVSRVQVLDCI